MQRGVMSSERESMVLRLDAVPPGVSGIWRLACAMRGVNDFVQIVHER